MEKRIIGKNNQVDIPAKYAESLGLVKGCNISIERKGSKIIIKRVD
jgi:antitoxin component of MazEF toxin-antitoxin module